MLSLKRAPSISILLVISLLFLFSCDSQPTKIEAEPGGQVLSGNGTIDPATGAEFLLGSVSDTVVAAGRIEIWAMNIVFDPADGIVSFDVQLLNLTGRTIPPPIHFIIASILPRDISVVDFSGVSPDGFPYYDFSAKLGSDNVLTHGERTFPVRMKFHTVTARSFAIGFRIYLGPAWNEGVIGGVVFRDDNRNGVRDRCETSVRCEPGIAGITVALEKPLNDGSMVTLLTRTAEDGSYRFAGFREGMYKVFVSPPENAWTVTSANPLLVTLVKGPDGRVHSFLGANFGLYPVAPPPTDRLFGPIMIGPPTPYGTLLDTMFVNPPSPLTVVFTYYLDAYEPPLGAPFPIVVDTAAAWINDELVFAYRRPAFDTISFPPQRITIRAGLVRGGENSIRLFTDGNEHAALVWGVYRKP